MITAGGLAFTGAMDAYLRAFDAKSGAELWQGRLPVPGVANPMTYLWKGEQYVAIGAGGHSESGTTIGDSLVAFRLARPGEAPSLWSRTIDRPGGRFISGVIRAGFVLLLLAITVWRWRRSIGRLQLALIAQPVAVATCEHAPDDIQPENPAGAVPTLEPQPLSAKPARRPGGGDMLLAAPAVRRYGVGRLPGRRWLKAALPAQVQCVDEPATLNAVFASACMARHLSLHFSSPNNRNRLANPALPLEAREIPSPPLQPRHLSPGHHSVARPAARTNTVTAAPIKSSHLQHR